MSSLPHFPTSRRILAGLAAAAVGASSLLVASGAHTSAAPSSPAVAAVQQVGEFTLAGDVVSVDGEALDNVLVAAYEIGSSEPAASALTYGGSYELHLDAGTYELVFSDLSGEYGDYARPGKLTVRDDVNLPTVTMKYPAPRPIAKPKIVGDAIAGQALRVVDGVWETDDITFTYRWLRDGKFTGVTSPTYKLGVLDIATEISVKVLASAPDSYDTALETRSVNVQRAESQTEVTVIVVDDGYEVVVECDDALGKAKGPVALFADGRLVATKKLTRSERATFVVGDLGRGAHTFKAVYKGDKVNSPSVDRAVHGKRR